MNAHTIAKRVLASGVYPELSSDDVLALAQEVVRLHAQRAPGDGDIPAPPADAAALRRAIEDMLEPPEDRDVTR
jgi:hypothetical protein